MRSPRTWIGNELRKSGVIRPVVDRFTDSQLDQMRALVALEMDQARSAASAPLLAVQLDQLRTLIESAIDSAIRDFDRSFTENQLEALRSTFASLVEQLLVASQSAVPQINAAPMLDLYASTAPSPQLAVDIFIGEWSSKLPAVLGVQSGESVLFEDSRIDRLIEWVGDAVVGARVLELGPLEAGHTYMLDRAGANVLAVESNSRAFLKCLIVKELLDLNRSHFVRGDFIAHLRESTDHFDLVLASGVLYHMVNPIELLTLSGARSDRLAIWTHYYTETLQEGAMARQFQAEPESVEFEDACYRLHPREYREALDWHGFCGGPETYARWMERDDIMDYLRRIGFSNVTISHDHPDHPNGPAFMLLAER